MRPIDFAVVFFSPRSVIPFSSGISMRCCSICSRLMHHSLGMHHSAVVSRENDRCHRERKSDSERNAKFYALSFCSNVSRSFLSLIYSADCITMDNKIFELHICFKISKSFTFSRFLISFFFQLWNKLAMLVLSLMLVLISEEKTYSCAMFLRERD